ncbi:MAG TPA: GNAT family N-acetyltransferase [Thermoanaerobaculia bacterium]
MRAIELTDRIDTPRLTLIAATPDLLRAELTAPPRIGEALGASVPADWPPGEYDRDAIAFFLERMSAGGADAAGWYGWYVLLRADEGMPALAGSAGYFGPPADGTAEIGYSLSTAWRGRGIATEAVRALVERLTRLDDVRRVVARTRPDNPASIAVLERNGFRLGASADPELRLYERLLVDLEPAPSTR